MKKEINDYKKKIDNELKRFFREKNSEIKKLSSDVYDYVSIFEEFTLRGGKRLRPLLMIFGYLSCGGKNTSEIIKASISSELAHSFLLVHDDIMDHDVVRRNGPTVHKVLEKRYDPEYAEPLAIVLGDAGFCYGLQPILDSNFDPQRKIKAMQKFVSVIEHTCYGQFFDVIAEFKDVDEVFVRNIHKYKTANYTIVGPMTIGGILAGATKRQLDSMTKFGIKIGLAFQLRDDILGVFGDRKELGKPIGSDLIEGKKTLLVTKADDTYIKKKLGTKLTKKEIEKIRKIIVDTGSLDYSQDLIHKLLESAKEDIEKCPIRKKEKALFLYLADYLEKRTS